MNALKVQVKNGRIQLDEPTELPEGTVIELRPVVQEPKKQLLWEEIQTLYPDEWVILVDLLYKEPVASRQTAGGVVFAHSKNKKEMLQNTKEALRGKSAAVFFTGKLMKDPEAFLAWKLRGYR